MTRKEWPSDPVELLHRVEERVPPAGTQERVAALLASGASGPLGLGLAASPLADAAGGTLQRLFRRFLAWSVVPLAAGIVIGASGQAFVSSKRAQAVAPVSAQVAATASAAASSTLAGPTAVSVAPSSSSVTSESMVGALSATPVIKAVTTESQVLERGILDRARQKLATQEPERALEFLEQHALRYPNGKLTEEREAMMVNVLVSLGRAEQAKARGEGFQRRFPSSLMRQSVQAALDANSRE